MRKKVVVKFLAILFIATMVCAGTAFGFNPSARDDRSRVTVGQNGYGDALLGQIYQSLDGYNTTIKVINTSDSLAIVARMQFRSALYSCHLRDFLIYLTPTDMFECEVRTNAAGNVEIYSTDDSVLSDRNFEWDGTAACLPFDGVWANEVPLQIEMDRRCLSGSDTDAFGHFEVMGLAAFPATPPLKKNTLALAYGGMEQSGVPRVEIDRLIACDFNLSGRQVQVPNVLTGTFEFDNTAYNSKASLNLLALKNWTDRPLMQQASTDETPLHDSASNTVAEIEASLAKTEYAIPFDFSSEGSDEIILMNTLPTRYEAGIGNSAYPGLVGGLCFMEYSVYDMSETVILAFLSPGPTDPCMPEVSMQPIRSMIQQAIDINPAYEKGWLRVILGNNNGRGSAMDPLFSVNYTGVPIINSSLIIDESGGSEDFSWKYAASPESTVYYTEIATDTRINVRQ